jgi:serine phosphatase RsbU (regulator of sigma subunit)
MILICDSRADADLRLVVTAWVGDSSAWILHPSGLWSCISANTTEDEEIAKSATDALPVLPSAGIDVRVSTIAPGDVLLSMTDGVGVALDKDEERSLSSSLRHGSRLLIRSPSPLK